MPSIKINRHLNIQIWSNIQSSIKYYNCNKSIHGPNAKSKSQSCSQLDIEEYNLYNNPSNNKYIEQIQYKAGLIVSGCWQGTNREKLNEELGWESLSDRRWFRRLNLFYKISNGLAPSYLADHIPHRSVTNISPRTRNQNILCRTERYQNSFFPFCIKNWKQFRCIY